MLDGLRSRKKGLGKVVRKGWCVLTILFDRSNHLKEESRLPSIGSQGANGDSYSSTEISVISEVLLGLRVRQAFREGKDREREEVRFHK